MQEVNVHGQTLEQAAAEHSDFPEIIANPPLENTTLVLSVPIAGEWHNGNLLRLIHAMLSQKTKAGQAFEVELVANIGNYLRVVLTIDQDKNDYKRDDTGKLLITPETQATTPEQKKAHQLINEMGEALAFIKRVITIQKIAASENNEELRQSFLQQETDPLKQKILLLAAEKAQTHSLALIDFTRTPAYGSDYKRPGIDMFRTVGADIASVRFENQKSVVLGLFDADTVFEDNHAVELIQQYFEELELDYLFLGMSNLAPGHSTAFVADAARENIRRTTNYSGDSPDHGSPQIFFRLQAYETLKELSGWVIEGFPGDEDRSTAQRLVYHFGSLQEGLLFQRSLEVGSLPPTSLTADRLDGTNDSAGRRTAFARDGALAVAEDMGSLINLRARVKGFIDTLPTGEQAAVLNYLNEAKNAYQKKQEKLQRFNRFLLSTFVLAVEQGMIRITGDQLETDEAKLFELTGGIALLHYIRANGELVKQVITNQDDLIAIKYFLGQSESLPNDFELTPFHLAIKEYVCTLMPFLQVDESFTAQPKDGWSADDIYAQWQVTDSRDPTTRLSLVHTVIAEVLALGRTYDVFFKTARFEESRVGSSESWPVDRSEQELPFKFGEQSDRLAKLRKLMLGVSEQQPQPAAVMQKSWWKNLDFPSFPIFRLFKALVKGEQKQS
jgi:hypothetical protein